ncbi:hypothetical protein AVEN_196766-1 [Araneus ventricosus]|uniref:Uncharacterized protein n=1 Tax=Araneus ventricosus TaxID=182803 RepID=A0A4Y2R688_ARAVE|nr:hypothetical protein AVEN_196766-1 [Araneus ventricosus]
MVWMKVAWMSTPVMRPYLHDTTLFTAFKTTTIIGLHTAPIAQWLARRKGVDGFSVETAGSGKHTFSPSSDPLTDVWASTVHKPRHNQASCGLMHSSFAYRQFNSNFTCGDPTILPYGLIHSRNRGTVGHIVLDVYASGS